MIHGSYNIKSPSIKSINFHLVSTENLPLPTSSSQMIQTISPEQKLAAVRYFANRLATYPLNETNKKKEYNTVKEILLNNKYDTQILDKISTRNNTKTTTQNKTHTTLTQSKTKWATFIYVGRQTKFIIKLFKNTNVNIAYKTNSTIGNTQTVL